MSQTCRRVTNCTSPNRLNESWFCKRAQWGAWRVRYVRTMLVETTGQLRRVVCDHHTGRETFCRSELVVVAHLAEIGPARHNDDRSRARERRDDRAHYAMRGDEGKPLDTTITAI